MCEENESTREVRYNDAAIDASTQTVDNMSYEYVDIVESASGIAESNVVKVPSNLLDGEPQLR